MVTFDLDAAHPDHRVKIEGLIRGLLARYPSVPLRQVKLYATPPDDRSLANANERGVIALNAFWFTQDPGVLAAAANQDYLVEVDGRMMGWHADPPMPEPDHVITHEFFHVAAAAMPQLRAAGEKAWLEATADPELASAGYSLAGPEEYIAEELAAYLLEDAGGAIKLSDLDDEDTEDAEDAEFEEQQHPRDPGGQFTEKGGGESAGGRAASAALKPAPADRNSWPAHIKALKVPPAWTDVRLSSDPKAALQATGKDVKGRNQYVYHPEFAKSQAAAKFQRIEQLIAKQQKVQSDIDKAARSSDPIMREHAIVAGLILALGLRPGSEKETGGDVKAYGATTLEAKHVATVRNKTRLRFVGKKGVKLDIPVDDPKLAAELQKRAASGGRLFPSVSDASLRHFVATLDGGGFHTKDMRTALAATTANELVAKMRAPHNPREYKDHVKKVATAVAQKLGNTPAVALSSYIPPVLFAPWRAALGL